MPRKSPARKTPMSELHRTILSSVMGVPWAISEAGLARVLGDVGRYLTNPQAVSAEPEDAVDHSWYLTKRDGIATMRVYGPLVSPSSWLGGWYPAYDLLAQELHTAKTDASIKQLVMVLDSPGGHVNGCHEFVQILRDFSAVKPTTAFVEGDACSAAYWVAAACNRIVTASTSVLGCLGAQVAHWDDSQMLANWGLREIIVTSSQTPLKNVPPTTDEGLAVWKQMVDDIAEVFLAGVADYRGRTREEVDAHFGRGAVLVGARAVTAGLADATGTYESLHADLVRGAASPAALAAQPMEATMARTTRRLGARRQATAAAHEVNADVRILVTRDVGVAEGDIGSVVEVRDGSFYCIRSGDAEYRWLAEDEIEAASTSEEPADSPTDDVEAESEDDDDDEDTKARRAKPSAFQRAIKDAVAAETKRIKGLLALATKAPLSAIRAMIDEPGCTPEMGAHRLITGQVKGLQQDALAQLAGDEAALGDLSTITDGESAPTGANAILATMQQFNPSALAPSARQRRG